MKVFSFSLGLNQEKKYNDIVCFVCAVCSCVHSFIALREHFQIFSLRMEYYPCAKWYLYNTKHILSA